MSPLNHKRTTSSLARAIFYAAKNWQFKDTYIQIEEAIDSLEAEDQQLFCCIWGTNLNNLLYTIWVMPTKKHLCDKKNS
jgi:hypothetical protein